MIELNNAIQLKEAVRTLVKYLGVLDKEKGCCCGLTFTQYCAVIEIGKAQEIVLRDLAEKLGLDKSTISRTVDSLVKMDLVTLEIMPENRRYVNIMLTNEGTNLFSKMEEGSNQYYQEILKSIPENKTKQIIESVELLLQAVQKHKCCE